MNTILGKELGHFIRNTSSGLLGIEFALIKHLFGTILHYLRQMGNPDLVVVGSGFFGSTIANLAANELDLSVLVIEKRDHVGGNAYSELDSETGIHIHKYGSHIFHTNQSEVWEYIQNFTKINNYRHQVKTIHNGEIFDFPINLATLSKFFKVNHTPKSANDLYEMFQKLYPAPQNFEEKAISMIGPDLYEAFVKNYTKKQWQIDPQRLPGGIISRIPARTDFNSNYFDDEFQGIPTDGYTRWILRMLDHRKILVQLGTDFFEERRKIKGNFLTIFTGPIDRYFDFKFGSLGWRTLDFEIEKLDLVDFQGVSVMNYPDLEFDFTRIHEFKHFQPKLKSNKTIIMKEYSRNALGHDEPYYPINTLEDKEKLRRYRKLATLERGVLFGGRLGSYQYLDMHMAIAAARTLYKNEIRPQYV